MIFTNNKLLFLHLFCRNLSWNAFTNIDKEAFRNLTELKRLDLTGNFLKDIDKDTFGGVLHNVERLRLANNSIKHIFAGAFDGFTNLTHL